MTTSTSIQRTWGRIWKGRGRFRVQILRIVGTILLLALASWLWDTAVRTAAMPGAYKKASLVMLAISLGLFIWGFYHLYKVLVGIGLRGVLWIALVGFLLLVGFNFLTSPVGISTGRQALSVVSQSWQQVWLAVGKSFIAVIKAPEDFRFAYTGSRSPADLSGFPIPDPAALKIVQIDARNYYPPAIDHLQPGGYAIISDTDGGHTACRSGPGSDSPISASFHENDRLLILEGPEADSDSLGDWWFVHGVHGEGWCLEEFLTPSN